MLDASKSHSRREFLKGAGLAGAATVLSTASVAGQTNHSKTIRVGSEKAKNLIFLVVDGMSSGTLALVHHWSLRNRQQPLNWMQLYGREGGARAAQDTASASSPVTDSAAASSSWGCGQRVNNGSINIAVDGSARTPILSYAKAAGKATGLVTTCTVTHATPAGFAANVSHRNQEDEIARQYLEREIDVILGGGLVHFERDMPPVEGVEQPGIHLLSDFEAKGYQVVQDREALTEATGEPRLLGLFSKQHVPYALDRKNDPSLKHVPSLPEMFGAALQSLRQSSNGFVLQVEGGRVDHAAHANDPAAILHEFLEYDQCIPIALDFLKEAPDTMLIITTDHGTGGCQLNGKGSRYAESGPALDSINDFKYSFEWLQDRFKGSGLFSSMIFKMATGIELDEAQAAKIQSAIDGEEKYLSSAMTKIVQPELWSKTAVGWTSNNHTAECVDLFAMGPGAELVPAFVENYQMFSIMAEALGIKVQA